MDLLNKSCLIFLDVEDDVIVLDDDDPEYTPSFIKTSFETKADTSKTERDRYFSFIKLFGNWKIKR